MKKIIILEAFTHMAKILHSYGFYGSCRCPEMIHSKETMQCEPKFEPYDGEKIQCETNNNDYTSIKDWYYIIKGDEEKPCEIVRNNNYTPKRINNEEFMKI